jgi:hypothetical protein
MISGSGAVTERVVSDARGRAYTNAPDLAVADDGTAWVLVSRHDADFQATYTSLIRVDDQGRVLTRLPELRYADIDDAGERYAQLSWGPGGTVWFLRESRRSNSDSMTTQIGKVDGAGAVPVYGGPTAGDLAAGPDDTLWFGLNERGWYPPSTTPTMGRLTADGRFTSFAVGSVDGALIAGPEDTIWFTSGRGIRRLAADGAPTGTFAPPHDAPIFWRSVPRATGATIDWAGPFNSTGDVDTWVYDVQPDGRRITRSESRLVLDGLRTGTSYEVTCRGVSAAGPSLPDRTVITPLADRAFGPAQDHDGDGRDDLAIFRPTTGAWYVRGAEPVRFGLPGDVPVPADFTGDGRAEYAVWRPATGTWWIRGVATRAWGQPGDIPVAADYTGDGKADLAVFRPSTGRWYVLGRPSVAWGAPGDIPVPANVLGDRRADLVVWRPSNGTFYRYGAASVRWGSAGDRPVIMDRKGDGRHALAVYRPSSGVWWVRGEDPITRWVAGGIPFAGAFDRSPGDDPALFRPWDGRWQTAAGVSSWGLNSDIPV